MALSNSYIQYLTFCVCKFLFLTRHSYKFCYISSKTSASLPNLSIYVPVGSSYSTYISLIKLSWGVSSFRAWISLSFLTFSIVSYFFFMHLIATNLWLRIDWAMKTQEKVPSPFLDQRRYWSMGWKLLNIIYLAYNQFQSVNNIINHQTPVNLCDNYIKIYIFTAKCLLNYFLMTIRLQLYSYSQCLISYQLQSCYRTNLLILFYFNSIIHPHYYITIIHNHSHTWSKSPPSPPHGSSTRKATSSRSKTKTTVPAPDRSISAPSKLSDTLAVLWRDPPSAAQASQTARKSGRQQSAQMGKQSQCKKMNLWRDLSYYGHCQALLSPHYVVDVEDSYVWLLGVCMGYQCRNIIRYKQESYNHQLLYSDMYHQVINGQQVFPLACDARSDTSTETDEFHTDQHSHLMHTQLTKTLSSKAKSSLCRNYTEKGFCPYDKKCQFAHGPDELRINMQTNRSYKTKGCHAFAKKGYCCYGQRCNFIHERIACENVRQKWTTIYYNHRQVVRMGERREQSRLLKLLGM